MSVKPFHAMPKKDIPAFRSKTKPLDAATADAYLEGIGEYLAIESIHVSMQSVVTTVIVERRNLKSAKDKLAQWVKFVSEAHKARHAAIDEWLVENAKKNRVSTYPSVEA
mmetsp:Transcript_32439/g.81737  ORF Transcript_32439/g.81737 Transcript_32439/m.81737 type:complete len:110 (+) Transcript_32439:1067-1396(+)